MLSYKNVLSFCFLGIWSILVGLMNCFPIKAQTFRNLFFNSFNNIIRLDFDSEPPLAISTGIAGSYEALAHFEDSEGNLLFFFNSNGVYNANGQFMSGSFGILANSSSAEVCIAPYPGNPNRFYLIYNAETCSSLYYSIIDMTLNGGLGNVISLNTLISNVNHSEGIEVVAIPGTNNYWLLTYRCNIGFTKYLINPSGINTGTVFYPYSMPTGGYDGRGEFDYHKGRIGACFAWSNQVFFADFDPVSGEVCNPVSLSETQFNNNPFGVEFSPSSNKMYISLWYTTTQNNVFQYDFLTGVLTGFLPVVGGTGFISGLGEIEMGRNGKLYIIQDEGTNITVINNPEDNIPDFGLIPINASTTGLGISDQIQANLISNVVSQTTHCVSFGENVLLTPAIDDQYWWAVQSAPTTVINISAELLITGANSSVTYIATSFVNNCFGNPNQFFWNIQPIPNLLASNNGDVCLGENVMLFGTVLSAGISNFYWTGPNGFFSTQQNPVIENATFASSGNYFFTAFDVYGCSNTVITNVEVLPLPNVNITGSDLSICIGESAVLIASGGPGTYLWNTGQTSSSISVSPNSTTLYIVTVTNSFGCSGSNSLLINVNNFVPPNLSDVETCLGVPVVLDAGSGYVDYQWSNGSSGQSILTNPQTTTAYFVTVSNTQNCTAETSATVTVLPLPIANAGEDQVICAGQSANLLATGGISYIWNTGSTTPSIIVQPLDTTEYVVTVTDVNGCSSANSVVIDVLQSFSVTGLVGNEPNIICLDENTYQVAFTISGGISPYWVNGEEISGSSYISEWMTSPQFEFLINDLQGCTFTESGDNSFCNFECTVNAVIQPYYDGLCYEGFEVQILNGPPQPPDYLYSLDGVNFQMSSTFSGIPPGNYPVYILTGCGSELIGNYTQTVSVFQVGLSVSPLGGNLYQYILTINGGQPPFSIVWSNGDTSISSIYQIDNLPASVSVTDVSGCERHIEFSQLGAVGFENFDSNNPSFSVYPNPAKDKFIIYSQLPQSEPVVIKLYTLYGQLITERQTRLMYSEVFDSIDLTSGLYLIEITDKHQSYLIKLFVQ